LRSIGFEVAIDKFLTNQRYGPLLVVNSVP
jgi:hypothetical protein